MVQPLHHLFIHYFKMPKRNDIWVRIVVLASGFLLLSWLFQFIWLAYLAAIILFVSLISFKIARYIDWAWMKFGAILGYINSRILLTLVFFLILTPIAFFYRIFASNKSFSKQKDPNSQYHPRNHAFIADDFEKMW